MPTREPPAELPADIVDQVKAARALQLEGQAKIDQAGNVFRTIAKQLTEQGWMQKDIAPVLGVSKQRVQQLVNPPAAKPGWRPAGWAPSPGK